MELRINDPATSPPEVAAYSEAEGQQRSYVARLLKRELNDEIRSSDSRYAA